MNNPRNGRPYRRLCAAQRALGLPCWLCGWEIDYQADARARESFTLDHAVPLSRGGPLLDPANARSAHRACNSSKGNRSSLKTVRTSRRW
ncbi:HNH endonuclease [Streptomyces sp. NBRC 109706]|uniref:HNH endonuclease n=1 Tax=Streptomyces sp. NBRC 109706 TaxID=1550035 RepID=UPI0007805998|nr:HNH endonuclease [Streptomyces sp. NBRC 109706]